ncbi:MAG: GAF domain-containing protein [Planctomycetota bacterium]|nr:GAF domain-containing protein [Planctomycetota bacterium]MDA1141069.1 GAF domain-containing protein [Planctomycetota bacterium]
MTQGNVSDLDKTLAFSRALYDFDEVESLLKFLISRFITDLEAERGFLILFEKGRHVYKFAQTFEGLTVDDPDKEISTSLVEEAVRRERAILVHDALADPHFAASKSIHRLELLSVVCAPLMTFHSRVIGVIYLDNRTEIERFSQRDCDMLEVLALHAGAALEINCNDLSGRAEESSHTGNISLELNQQFRRTLTDLTGQIQASHWLYANGAATNLREIQTSLRRGLELTRAVQTLAAPPRKDQFQPCDLKSVIEAALSHVTGLRDQSVDPKIGQVMLECSPPELQQAFEELLKNAWEATHGMKDRQVAVTGGIAHGTAWVSITDNGMGFSDESQERAGEAFFTTKKNVKGLGLNVAAAIINSFDGTLTWASQDGRTEVRVELPNAVHKPEVSPDQIIQKGKILLVDDSSTAAAVLVQTLTRHGHDVTHVTAPDEAETRLNEIEWDLLLVDGGFSLSQLQSLIRSAKALPIAPGVILLTSWTEWSHAAELSQADMAVSKPIQLRYLPRVIAQALQAR